MVEDESCITFFWLGDVGYREGCCVYFSCLYLFSGGSWQETENLAHCFALLLYYIISLYLQRCNNNTILSDFAHAFTPPCNMICNYHIF